MSMTRPCCNCTHCRTGADDGRHISDGSAAAGAAGVAGFAAGSVRGPSGSSVDRRFGTNDAEDFHRSLLPPTPAAASTSGPGFNDSLLDVTFIETLIHVNAGGVLF